MLQDVQQQPLVALERPSMWRVKE